MATTPEQSDYTSIQQRIHQAQQSNSPNAIRQQVAALMPFVGDPRQDMPKGTLERLNIEPQHWLYLSRKFESPFKELVGPVYKLEQACDLLGYQRMPGLNSCALYFP